jgi:sRNA-binding protein
MKKLFVCLNLIAFFSIIVSGAPARHFAPHVNETKRNSAQQNLIGEVSSIDPASGKMVIQTDAKASVTVTFNDKTAFRRVSPGQTSLANAETITAADLKPGDRVLIPAFNADAAQTPVRQIVVMARASIEQTRNDEVERRRARTTIGRITSVNAEKREITVQTRGRGDQEALIVAAPAQAKVLRYAPDSLKPGDAVASSFAALQTGDQVRVLGERSTDGTRITAEEILSGSVSRAIGIVTDINAARGEVTLKNDLTGQSMTVATGKNTTLRRITPEVATTLRERFERRNARRRASNSAGNEPQPASTDRPRSRDRRRTQTSEGQANNPNRRQLFENLPAVALGEIKKGDAVLITGTTTGGNSTQMTAVSIIVGEGELQQILLRTQGGRNGSNISPGLPGNVSGGNAAGDDDEPER